MTTYEADEMTLIQLDLEREEALRKRRMDEIGMLVVIAADHAEREVHQLRQIEAMRGKWGENAGWKFCGAGDDSRKMTPVSLRSVLRQVGARTDILEAILARQMPFEEFLLLVDTRLRSVHPVFQSKDTGNTPMIDEYDINEYFITGTDWTKLERNYKASRVHPFEEPFSYRSAKDWLQHQQTNAFEIDEMNYATPFL